MKKKYFLKGFSYRKKKIFLLIVEYLRLNCPPAKCSESEGGYSSFTSLTVITLPFSIHGSLSINDFPSKGLPLEKYVKY